MISTFGLFHTFPGGIVVILRDLCLNLYELVIK